MLGCHARALGRDLKIDESELEDARWFTRAQVVQALRPAAGASV
jgi:NAD+ diphosphatase